MHGRFARGFHELTKQSLCKRIRVNHSLGMPLNAGDPIRIPRPLDSFNHPIGGARGHAKTTTDLKHGLMMRAVYACFIFRGQLGETRPWLNSDGVKRLGRASRPYVPDLASELARDILNQRTFQENVQALNAKTNGENWFVFGESMLEKREIGLLAFGIGISTF